jgi:hypothetical protein
LKSETDAVTYLRSPRAIRDRTAILFDLVQSGESRHFTLDLDKLGGVVSLVHSEIVGNYPTLDVPYHSRWRHFGVGGINRERILTQKLSGAAPREVARAKLELAIVSVLLDAGAGDAWRFVESGASVPYSRSEGLAVASLHAFHDGVFGDEVCTVCADKLISFTPESLEKAFQVTPLNPLLGVQGRATLLQSLGQVIRSRPEIFGEGNSRLGNFIDLIAPERSVEPVKAGDVLQHVLSVFSPIWPGRVSLAGVNLGDVWTHSQVVTNDGSSGLVPFHKLSQWLTYSLLEPLVELGVPVVGVDELTGLAEYRNGGLFLDGGVLQLKDPTVAAMPHAPSSELIVEWRALTVQLLDRVATGLRKTLGMTAETLPLAKVLQGGTWSVGRKLAFEQRASGEPPLSIVSDGTVF